MRAKEKQDDVNMKLLEGLNIIEKKLEKESGLRKSGSHKSSYEKGKAISVSRHHHHSRRHSNKKEGKNSSPSPVRRHKRYGLHEL